MQLIDIPNSKSKVYNGHVMDALRLLPDNSVDCTITSSPYWGLRDYGKETKAIWDSDLSCEHIWQTKETYHDALRGNKYTDTAGVGNNNIEGRTDIRDEDTGIVKDGYCTKCGAWYGQLGLEADFHDFVRHLVQIFHEVKRVTKPTGALWVNLGDSYSGSNSTSGSAINPDTISYGAGQNVAMPSKSIRSKTSLPSKCLIGIPWRVALAMEDDGWILRNAVIWYKLNGMPSSVRDRMTNRYEMIFFFTKSRKYYFDLDAIRAPMEFVPKGYSSDWEYRQKLWALRGKNSDNQFSKAKRRGGTYQGKFEGNENPEAFGSPRARTQRTQRKQDNVPSHNASTYEGFNDRWRQKYNTKYDGQPEEQGVNASKLFDRTEAREEAKKLFPDSPEEQQQYINYVHDHQGHPMGKNPGDVWVVPTHGYKGAHFATFPMPLVYRPILSTCPQDGIVMDPFSGSGTSLIVAEILGRHSLGIEINPSYIDLIKGRFLDIKGQKEMLLRALEKKHKARKTGVGKIDHHLLDGHLSTKDDGHLDEFFH